MRRPLDPSDPTVLLAVKVPRSLLAAVDKRGGNRSAVVRDLLARGLAERGTVEGELARLGREVQRLRKAVEGRRAR